MTTHSTVTAPAGAMDPQKSPGTGMTGERIFIVLVCFLAGLRIFLFSAAFPFFNNVDEEAHLDLVCKLAGGHLPQGLEPFGRQAADLIAAHRSPEYYQGIPGAETFNQKASLPESWTSSRNHEATSPPVYYGLAALWFNVGRTLDLSGAALLYWIRFLNIPVFMGVVWLAYLFGTMAFPSSWHLRLGLPLVVAFLPQDVFYSINSNVLCAPLAGAALFCLAKLYAKPRPDIRLCAITGLWVAGSCLTTLMNLPLFVVALIVLAWKFRRPAKFKDNLPQVFAFGCAALIPMVIWCVRNLVVVGDLTGTHEKLQLLGWSLKPVGEMWSHPIFTLKGLSAFWHGLMGTFWRGEFYWHGSRLAAANIDAFYSISSALFIGIGVMALFFAKWTGEERLRRGLIAMSAVSVLCFVGLLVALSVVYDFGNCPYPSRAHPYFTSGRLISGALIPFVTVYLVGLDFVLRGFRSKWIFPGVLVAVLLVATLSEICLSWGVFSSGYNWFHL